MCGLIAQETAALRYGVGAAGIPTAEVLRHGLETFAAAAGDLDVHAHLAWIDREFDSAREFENTGQDTAHLLDPDRLNIMSEAAVQMEAVWKLFSAAVRMPRQQDRQAMKDMAVTMTEAGGLDDVLLGTSLEGPRLTISSLRAELETVRAALQAEQAHNPNVDKAIQNNVPEMEM